MIIPAYNEESSIVRTVNRVRKFNKTHRRKIDYIVIDDGSTDRTQSLLKLHHIPSIRIESNSGIGGAVKCGYRYALEKKYRYAVQFDGDGQHGIEYIYDMVAPIENGEAEMVIGSRFAGLESYYKPSFIRRIGIGWISLLIRIKSGEKIKDPTSGYRAVGHEGMRSFAYKYPTRYPEPESCLNLLFSGMRVKEIPVRMHRRTGGKSSISSWRKVDYMIRVTLALLAA